MMGFLTSTKRGGPSWWLNETRMKTPGTEPDTQEAFNQQRLPMTPVLVPEAPVDAHPAGQVSWEEGKQPLRHLSIEESGIRHASKAREPLKAITTFHGGPADTGSRKQAGYQV